MRTRPILRSLAVTALLGSTLFAGETAMAGVPTCQGSNATAPAHLGNGGNNTITGTPGDDVLIGMGGNDTIDGKGGLDIICGESDAGGGNGKDTLRGGPGQDTLLGNNGNDRLFGGDVRDNLFGGPGDDLLDGGGPSTGTGGDEANYIFASTNINGNLITGKATGEGTDTLKNIEGFTGGSGDDTFTGNGKGNSFSGGAEFFGPTGDDRFIGKGGVDTVSYSFTLGSNFISLEGGTAIGDGDDSFSSIETAIGGPGNDEIAGSDKPNVLFGADGHDTLWGRSNDDILIGFAGFDSLYGGEGVADFASYSDTNLDVNPLPVVIDLLNGTAQRADGDDVIEGIEMVEGSDAADNITGDHGPNFFYGDEDNDIIDGKGGSDLIFFLGASGNMTVDLSLDSAIGMGTDDIYNVEHVVGGAYTDNITGDEKRNFLNGSGGTDWLKGLDNDDYLAGGPNNDQFEGGDGNDIVDFFQSNKSVHASLKTSQSTGEGTDSFLDVESLSGTNKNDTLEGNSRMNSLFGQGGKDKLFGYSHEDELDGGKATDSLNGGQKADKCYTKPESVKCESFKKPGEHPLTEVGRRYKRALASARRYK